MKSENIMIKKKYIKYIATFIITLILVFTIAVGIELELLFRCEKKVNFEELNLKNLSKFFTISQLEKLIEQNPDDSAPYIRIAEIYNRLDEPAKANSYYKKAIVVSKRSNFSLYSYAIFCANNGFINLATTLAEEIRTNNMKTYEFRAKIYEAIADNMDENAIYDGANMAYKIAYKYAKNVDNKKLYNRIKEKYAVSYTKTADEKIEEGLVDEAIIDLKNSIKVKSNPLAKYKLALVYKNIDLKMSELYMSQTLRDNPYIVNPYIYNSILDTLYNKANYENDSTKIDYYYTQKKKFTKKMLNAYLYKKDITISKPKFVSEKSGMFSKEKKYLAILLKNNTKQVIDSLYIQVHIIRNSHTDKIEKKIITKLNPLIYYSNPQAYKIELSDEIITNINNKADDMHLKFFCKKAKNAPWTLVSILKVNN